MNNNKLYRIPAATNIIGVNDLKSGPISWTETAQICDDYKEILYREHPGNELYVNRHGTIRWVPDENREQEIMNMFNASDLNEVFRNGTEKNSLIVRELYKVMGVSLSMFWEVFYWEVNNKNASKFKGRLTDKQYTFELLKYKEEYYEE